MRETETGKRYHSRANGNFARSAAALESGRSMLETLGVLAIVGVLSIAAVAGMTILRDKSKANAILEDSRRLFVETVARGQTNPISTEWHKLEIATDSGKELFVRQGQQTLYYVRATAVETGVCQQLLGMEKAGVVSFLKTDLTNLTSCLEGMDIVVDWNPKEACETYADCPENTFCSSDFLCEVCSDIEKLNETKTGCVCEIAKALTCELDGVTWCCGGNTVCGVEPEQCVPSDGTCAYRFSGADSPDMTCYADCSYEVADVTYIGGDCSYEIYKIDHEEAWAENGQSGTKHVTEDGGLFVREGQACTNPEHYCAAAWVDPDGDTGNDGHWTADKETPITDNAVIGTVWGKCQPRDTFDTGAIVSWSGTTVVTLTKGCDNPEHYCAANWTQEEWETDATEPVAQSNAINTIWGRCQDRDVFITQPLLKNDGGPLTYTVEKECPAETFCYLNWENKTTCNTLNNNATGLLYGDCAPKNGIGECPFK